MVGIAPADVLAFNIFAGAILNEETSGSDYSEFMSQFAPFPEQIAGLFPAKFK